MGAPVEKMEGQDYYLYPAPLRHQPQPLPKNEAAHKNPYGSGASALTPQLTHRLDHGQRG